MKKNKKFDAVLESRKWKEAVSCEIAGMTLKEKLEYFNRDRVMEELRRSCMRSLSKKAA